MPERVRTNTQAKLRLAWGGLAKGNQAQASFQKSPGGQKEIGAIRLTGLGARAPKDLEPSAWGRGVQELPAPISP